MAFTISVPAGYEALGHAFAALLQCLDERWRMRVIEPRSTMRPSKRQWPMDCACWSALHTRRGDDGRAVKLGRVSRCVRHAGVARDEPGTGGDLDADEAEGAAHGRCRRAQLGFSRADRN
jgi:hypothetical protein